MFLEFEPRACKLMCMRQPALHHEDAGRALPLDLADRVDRKAAPPSRRPDSFLGNAPQPASLVRTDPLDLFGRWGRANLFDLFGELSRRAA